MRNRNRRRMPRMVIGLFQVGLAIVAIIVAGLNWSKVSHFLGQTGSWLHDWAKYWPQHTSQLGIMLVFAAIWFLAVWAIHKPRGFQFALFMSLTVFALGCGISSGTRLRCIRSRTLSRLAAACLTIWPLQAGSFWPASASSSSSSWRFTSYSATATTKADPRGWLSSSFGPEPTAFS